MTQQLCQVGHHRTTPAVSINGMHWCDDHRENPAGSADRYRMPETRYFNWSLLFNGETHTLTGEMFGPMSALEFGRQARKMAARRDLIVQVKTTSVGSQGAIVRCAGRRPRFGVAG